MYLIALRCVALIYGDGEKAITRSFREELMHEKFVWSVCVCVEIIVALMNILALKMSFYGFLINNICIGSNVLKSIDIRVVILIQNTSTILLSPKGVVTEFTNCGEMMVR